MEVLFLWFRGISFYSTKKCILNGGVMILKSLKNKVLVISSTVCALGLVGCTHKPI